MFEWFLFGAIRKYSPNRNSGAERVGTHSNGEQRDKRKCNRALGKLNLLLSHIARRLLMMTNHSSSFGVVRSNCGNLWSNSRFYMLQLA